MKESDVKKLKDLINTPNDYVIFDNKSIHAF